MGVLKSLFLVLALIATLPAVAGRIVVAAASDLKFAMDEIVADYSSANPGDEVEVIYGSSGKFHAQVQNGAPYDLFFSADIAYAEALVASGHAASAVVPYARGRLVLWSDSRDASRMTLESLADAGITRIAIANPRHAPYGKRAEEALRATGVWEQVRHKLVHGENISHAAQFVQTGNAQVGVIALALALSPALAGKGGFYLVPESLHEPLEQGFIITARAADNPAARRFADFIGGSAARTILTRYGFVLPERGAMDSVESAD